MRRFRKWLFGPLRCRFLCEARACRAFAYEQLKDYPWPGSYGYETAKRAFEIAQIWRNLAAAL